MDGDLEPPLECGDLLLCHMSTGDLDQVVLPVTCPNRTEALHAEVLTLALAGQSSKGRTSECSSWESERLAGEIPLGGPKMDLAGKDWWVCLEWEQSMHQYPSFCRYSIWEDILGRVARINFPFPFPLVFLDVNSAAENRELRRASVVNIMPTRERGWSLWCHWALDVSNYCCASARVPSVWIHRWPLEEQVRNLSFGGVL